MLRTLPVLITVRSHTWTARQARALPVTGLQMYKYSSYSHPVPRELSSPSVAVMTRASPAGGKVATIILSNPSKLNVVNRAILEDLKSTCETLSSDPSLRVAILTGGPTQAGKSPAFIGGADILEMHKLETSTEAEGFIGHVHAACQALRTLPVPVIARIHGICLGAGLEIMAACDLRIATRPSTFGMPEVLLGIPSVVEAALLPGLISMGRTRRLLYLAENIDGDIAERWGLIERVVPDEAALEVAVDDWANRITDMGARAIRSQKALMQKWENCSLEDGIRAGIDSFSKAYADGGMEPKALMGRFINRKR